MKTLYAVTHEHQSGTSAYLVRSNHCPTEEEVVAALRIDFEPERCETISIGLIDSGDIREIPD